MDSISQSAFERHRSLIQLIAWSYAVNIHSLMPLLLRDIRVDDEGERIRTTANLGLVYVDHARVRTLARRWSCDADCTTAALFWDEFIATPEFRQLLLSYLNQMNSVST